MNIITNTTLETLKYDLVREGLVQDEVVAKLEESIKALGGSVISTDKMGRKKLAFEVAGFTDGFVVNQVVTMPADKITELKRQLKLNDSVIRIMFTTKECA